MSFLLALALAIHLTTPQTSSVEPTGSELLRACNAAVRLADGEKLDPLEETRGVWCIGYVAGFLDGLTVLNWKGGDTKVCLPKEGIENDQALRVLVKYLKAHPEVLHQSGRVSLVIAIGQAFPCK